MKTRHLPKVWMKHHIVTKGREGVGYIQLVDYMCGKSVPHIEYALDVEYQQRGIMSYELPKYLKMCKKREIYQMMALVRKNNAASIRILEKNGFVKIKDIDNTTSYLIDIRITPDIAEEIIRKCNFNNEGDLC